ncbi:MAG: DUF4239 domain-containing protein [Rubrobacter sp.]|nr:DUF4239 domain-containing protein [Rubrobacter sp.]
MRTMRPPARRRRPRPLPRRRCIVSPAGYRSQGGAGSRTLRFPTSGQWWKRNGPRWRGRPSAEAWARADSLQESVQGLDPRTPAAERIYSASLTNVDDLDEARALRLLEIREGLPPLLWIVLFAGAVVTVSFTFLFGMDTLWLHAMATGALTALVVLILYVISVLEYPFDGNVRVGPEAFELALRAMGG